MGKLSPAAHYRCYIHVYSTGLRSGEFVGHSVGGMKSSRPTFRSRKATVSRARSSGALYCRKTKTHPGISRIDLCTCMPVASGQEDCSLCPIHFATRIDKWISLLPIKFRNADLGYVQI